VQQRADARLHLQPDDQRTGVRYATFLVSGRTTGAPHLWKDVLAQLSVVIAMLEVKRRVTPSAHNPPYALSDFSYCGTPLKELIEAFPIGSVLLTGIISDTGIK
jgi:hypothetical protein